MLTPVLLFNSVVLGWSALYRHVFVMIRRPLGRILNLHITVTFNPFSPALLKCTIQSMKSNVPSISIRDVAITKTYIMKTCLYNFDPLKPHFYIVKLGFAGVYIIFLISARKHRLWVFVRTASPRRF